MSSQTYRIDGPMNIQLGSDAVGDLYYNAGTPLQMNRLAISTNVGDRLTVGGSSIPEWQPQFTYTATNSATVSVSVSDQTVGIDYSATGTCTVTLPAISSLIQVVNIVDTGGNAGTNNITINPTGSDTIQGTTTTLMNIDHLSLTFKSNGVDNWMVI